MASKRYTAFFHKNYCSNNDFLALSAQEMKSQSLSRFRKRDKALFYGRKMLRKVKNISGQVRNSGQGRKRKMVMKFARRILQLKKDNDSEQLKVRIFLYVWNIYINKTINSY